MLPDHLDRRLADAVRVPGAVVSCAAAAAVWRIPALAAPTGPLITVDRNRSRVRPGGLVPVRADVPAEDLVQMSGFCVTTPLRTVLDLAPQLCLPAAVAAMDDVLHRRLAKPGELEAAAAVARGPGAAAIRKAARLADRRAMSVFESIARVGVVEAGWGPVVPQLALEDGSHCYDLGLEWARVMGECQSKEFHSEWGEVQQDYAHERAVARSRGWGLVPWVWRDFWPDPAPGLLKLLEVIVEQPGPRCRAFRARYLTEAGLVLPPRTQKRAPTTKTVG